ncbi:MAG: site-specific DNA-methyltransferase [Planctomycetaceae bacterium]|nr:site-specific DNA-methyltransferase [Planctomycetaceae bacterium]
MESVPLTYLYSPQTERLVRRFCRQQGTVLDNFAGSGTTLVAAKRLGRNYYGIDILPEFCQIARRRLDQMALCIAG